MKERLSLASLFVVLLASLFIETGPDSSRSVIALQASPAAVADTFELTGLVETPGPVTIADLQTLPVETVEVTYELDGAAQTHRFTGVRLWDVLARAKPIIDPNRKNDPLRKYIVLTASDGYQVVITLGEIDPSYGGHPYLLAWEQDDTPLTGDQGPVQLVTPGDKTSGRYIWGIDTIDVRDVDSPPPA